MTTIGMQNLNTPATQPGALCEADLDAKQRDLGAWHMLAEPLPIETEPRWVRWLVYPAVIAITVAACYVWPLWIQS